MSADRMSVNRTEIAGPGAGPDLAFAVEGARVLEFAAAPTLCFLLRIEAGGGEPIRSIALSAQLRIAAARRSYDRATQERLVEVFGASGEWGTTVRSLLWAHAAVQVPPFTGRTVVELPLACTYDFEVAAAKYLHALEDGDVPLEFLFSGTIFYAGEGGLLRVGRISWEKEAGYRLPVRVWREMMEHYFPNSAWIRLRRDIFDRLCAYRARRAHPTWEAALEALLRTGGGEAEG